MTWQAISGRPYIHDQVGAGADKRAGTAEDGCEGQRDEQLPFVQRRKLKFKVNLKAVHRIVSSSAETNRGQLRVKLGSIWI
jgi:hypothetical protein